MAPNEPFRVTTLQSIMSLKFKAIFRNLYIHNHFRRNIADPAGPRGDWEKQSQSPEDLEQNEPNPP